MSFYIDQNHMGRNRNHLFAIDTESTVRGRISIHERTLYIQSDKYPPNALYHYEIAHPSDQPGGRLNIGMSS